MITTSRDALIQEALAQIDAQKVHRRRAFCAQALHRDVSLPQLHILITLQECGPMMVSELAGLLRISMPSTSSILDRMEDHGFVERVRDREDRRVVRVAISEPGRTIAEDFVGLQHEQVRRILGVMTDDEIRDFIVGMQALERAMSRLHDVDDGIEEAS